MIHHVNHVTGYAVQHIGAVGHKFCKTWQSQYLLHMFAIVWSKTPECGIYNRHIGADALAILQYQFGECLRVAMCKDNGIGRKTDKFIIGIVEQCRRVGSAVVPTCQDIAHHLLIASLHQIADECRIVIYGIGAHSDCLGHTRIIQGLVVIMKAGNVIGVSVWNSLFHILNDCIKQFIDIRHTLAPAPVSHGTVVVAPCLLVLGVLAYLVFP